MAAVVVGDGLITVLTVVVLVVAIVWFVRQI
jgi:hypothetical protein